MKAVTRTLLACFCFCGPTGPAARAGELPAPLTAVPFQRVHLADDFWGPKIAVNSSATIAANLQQCEVTGRIKNFAAAGKLTEGKHQGLLFNDSDVYKMIEGIAYALASRRDAELERRTDEIIDQIAAAQQPDGYLNSYYTLVEPDKRWRNIQYGHELYCAGHLIEAAVAYQQATGKRKLLEVAARLADHIGSVFGADRRHDTCGHEELELALVKLWRATGQRRYLELAKFFIDMRGSSDARRLFGEYAQDHKPVREQTEVCGHAVRAMYLYSGMADVAAASGDQRLFHALQTIWHDVVDRKMYLTGGIGPSASNEGFTVPYDLPNDSAYAETCAAIGMALWNHRMFLMTGDGRYADVLEREVYNGLLSGVSLSGDRFFCVNPLASRGNHHRVPWFDCSCCPTNIVRYIPGMGERAYATRGDGVWALLYLGGEAEIDLPGGKLQLAETTRYPWEGRVEWTVLPEKPMAFDFYLRIPGWCHAKPSLKLNDKPLDLPAAEQGYVKLARTWQPGDTVALDLPMAVERVYADPHVAADFGRVAIQRGPVVYCLEAADNGGHVRNLCLPRDAKLAAKFEPDVLGGVAVVTGAALSVSRDGEALVTQPVQLRAVPYYAWDNREPGEMVVWAPETPELAEIAGEGPPPETVAGVKVRASHCFANDTVRALADGELPRSSGDHGLPRMTFWDHLGTREWVWYEFPEPRKIGSSAVYWFDDTGRGRCRLPAEWRLLWLDGKVWKPVKLAAGAKYAVEADRFNDVAFEPVTTRGLKLEVKLQPDVSGGILEWQVK